MIKNLLLLFIFLLSSASSAFSQKKFDKFMKKNYKSTCGNAVNSEAAIKFAPVLEKYISRNPKHYDAYYELAMQYYIIAFSDKSKREEYAVKAIEMNDKFIALAPENYSKISTAYSNNAIIYNVLGNCAEAVKNIKNAKNTYKLSPESWDALIEESIINNCKSKI